MAVKLKRQALAGRKVKVFGHGRKKGCNSDKRPGKNI